MQENKRNYYHLFLAIIVLGFMVWSLINPKSYGGWAADAGPFALIVIVALFTYKKFTFTSLSYTFLAILAILEFIGGHYTFQDEPFFHWLKEKYDLKRNYYDRLGHLMMGLSAIIFREVLIRIGHIRKGFWLTFYCFSILMMISALYEIAEMLTYTMVQGKSFAKGFLGLQGDKWDSEWDMTMALIGTILALLIFTKWHNKFLQKKKGSS